MWRVFRASWGIQAFWAQRCVLLSWRLPSELWVTCDHGLPNVYWLIGCASASPWRITAWGSQFKWLFSRSHFVSHKSRAVRRGHICNWRHRECVYHSFKVLYLCLYIYLAADVGLYQMACFSARAFFLCCFFFPYTFRFFRYRVFVDKSYIRESLIIQTEPSGRISFAII